MKYISRIDSISGGTRTRCYFVRVPRIIDGKRQPYNDSPVNRSFPKGTGTWPAAFQKAIAWRDAYLKKHDHLYLLDGRYARPRGPMRNTGRTKSGIVGVHLGLWRKVNSDSEYWCGIFSKNDKQRRQSFAVGKLGFDNAFIRACIVRFENCGTLIVTDRSKLPCLPPVDWYNMKTDRLYEKCPVALLEKYDAIRKEFPFEY